MSIFLPEAAASYGALDSTAFVDGYPVTAHALRAIARNSNYMITRAEPLFNLNWSYTGQHRAMTFLSWVRILPAFPVVKRPDLISAEIKLRLTGTTSDIFDVQVATLARPFSDDTTIISTTSAVGAGDSTTVSLTISDIPMRPGTFEVFEIWIRAQRDSVVTSGGTYGTPVSGRYDGGTNNAIVLLTAAWVSSFGTPYGPSLSNTGHYLQFEDGVSPEPLVAPRKIVGMINSGGPSAFADTLFFDPPLTQDEFNLVDAYRYFRLVETPRVNLSGVAGIGMPRSLY